jgi:hypothetical protein
MKRLFAAHPAILSLVVFAFIIDAVMVASTGGLWEDASFALGSTLVVAYFFGISLFLRFVVFRNRIHAGITWVATILICWGWFTLQVALDQSPYRPSFLFIMCLLAAFKTMRLQQSGEEKNEAEQRLANDDSGAIKSESDVCEDQNDEHLIIGKKEEANPVTPPSAPPSSTKTTIVPLELTNTGDRQSGLRSLKQVLAIMAAIGCLVALWDMPDDYYKVLRFMVVAACAAIIWNVQKSGASEAVKTLVSVAFGMLAVFFNPIMPIDIEYDKWYWIRIFALGLFIGGILPNHFIQSFSDWWRKNGVKVIVSIIISIVIVILLTGIYVTITELTNHRVIDDETAARYYHELDILTGPERKSRADALLLWADVKDRQQIEKLKKIYSDFDGYVNEAGLQKFDEDSRYRIANRQFIASQFDQTPEEQQDTYTSFRDKWNESMAGKKGMSEKETFRLIRNHILGIGKATKSKVEIIDDATATRIYNEIDNATGDERQQMADALLTWGEKKAKEEYNQADEHFSNLFLDEQYYAEQVNAPDIYQAYQAYKATPFPKEAAQRAVLQAYLQHASGAPVSADTYETIRDSYAQAKFGKSPVSDDEMFDLIRGQYETQMIQRAKQAFQIGLKKHNQPNS